MDILLPTIFTTLIVLVIFPQSRKLLFPPAPIALVNTETGGVQKPKAGVLGSHDSVTGAPEKFKGEAAEQEANNLIASVATVAVGSAAGKHDQGTPQDAPMEDQVPDAMEIVSKTADAQAAARGEDPSDDNDKSREPMRQTVLNGADQGMRIMADVVDTWERFGKYVIFLFLFDIVVTDSWQFTIANAPVFNDDASSATGWRAGFWTPGGPFNIQLCIHQDEHLVNWVWFLRRPHYPARYPVSEPRISALEGVVPIAEVCLTQLWSMDNDG